jgi:hypothetical protein
MSLHPASPPTAARDLFAGLLPVDERVLDPEHRAPWPTAPTSPALPGRDAGDPATARDLFAGLLPVRQRVIGLREDRQRSCGRVVAMACGSDLKARAAPDR